MTAPPGVPPPATPPGWYPAGEVLRWWDGQRWTEQIAPLNAMPKRPPRSNRRRYTTGFALGVGLAVLAVSVVSGGGYVLVGGVDGATDAETTLITTLSTILGWAGLIGGALYGGRR